MVLDPIPLTPDPDDARRWLEEELSDPRYVEAQPQWFDVVAKNIQDFLAGLFRVPEGDGSDTVLMIVIGVVVIAVAIVAVLIWGRPRLRRTSEADTDALFDDDDDRSAAQLRASSEAAAAENDFAAAVVLRMRAIARSLRERGAVTTGPGATVHAFAEQATRAFPMHAAALSSAADGFDDVRYLRRPGTPELFHSMRELDRALEATRPAALATFEAIS